MNLLFLVLYLSSYEAMVPSTMPAQQEAQEHSEKIAFSDILGIWRAEDSLQNHMEFVNVESVHVEMRGIKHGVNYYIFQMTGDSIQTRGMAINWPPYDCELNLVNSALLQLSFYQFNDTIGNTVRYLR